MFGIGIGEIILIMLIIFLISPKELPKVMKKIGQFFRELNRLKQEVMQLKKDVGDIVEEAKIDADILDEELMVDKGNKKNKIYKKNIKNIKKGKSLIK